MPLTDGSAQVKISITGCANTIYRYNCILDIKDRTTKQIQHKSEILQGGNYQGKAFIARYFRY